MNKNLDYRKLLCSKLFERYGPKCVPIIVAYSNILLKNYKFVFTHNDLIKNIMIEIKKHFADNDSEYYLATMSGECFDNNSHLKETYQKYKDADGFLYINLYSCDKFGKDTIPIIINYTSKYICNYNDSVNDLIDKIKCNGYLTMNNRQLDNTEKLSDIYLVNIYPDHFLRIQLNCKSWFRFF